eukprot:m.80645 g.80645  ORF g.80645 m.80645 type:complete len:221 (-) comp8208_c0_seq5:3932-4594(-)
MSAPSDAHRTSSSSSEAAIAVKRSAPVAIPRRSASFTADESKIGSPSSFRYHSPKHASLSTSPSIRTEHLRERPEEEGSRRRAVSDAAQWIRARQQSELQRELLPSDAPGAQQHKFAWSSYSKPTFCAVCSKILWGFSRCGLQCSECGMDIHKQCQALSPACLGRQGSLASLEKPVSSSPSLYALAPRGRKLGGGRLGDAGHCHLGLLLVFAVQFYSFSS